MDGSPIRMLEDFEYLRQKKASTEVSYNTSIQIVSYQAMYLNEEGVE